MRSPEYDWGSFGFDLEVTKGGNPIEFDDTSHARALRAGVRLFL